MFDVEFNFRDNHTAANKAIHKGVNKGINDCADRIVELAKTFAPVNTGNLARGISRMPIQIDKTGEHSCIFGCFKIPYAAAVEWGSGERGEPIGSTYSSPAGAMDWPRNPPGKNTYGKYPIRPKNKKALHFKGKDGKDVFVKEVWHPGIVAHPFMRPAVDIVRINEARRIFGEAIKSELRRQLGVG